MPKVFFLAWRSGSNMTLRGQGEFDGFHFCRTEKVRMLKQPITNVPEGFGFILQMVCHQAVDAETQLSLYFVETL